MARKSDGTVYINTLVDTKGFGKGMNTMQKQVNGLNGALGKLGKVIAATFAVGKLVQFGKEAIDLGSDLQEVQNVVDVTFTTMNEQVNEFARNAAETAGLSEAMAKRYIGTFGAMAKAFGFAEEEAFDMSSSLTQLAGDVASFYNLTQDEAYTKLKSVFTGETETLKDLGVVMTQNALDAYAMAEGYGKTTKQMSEQEKVALRYSFVLDQLSAAQGDFVRTSDSWANQTRILNLNFDSFKANIGQALINIFTPFLKVINQIVAKMAQLSSRFVAFSELIVGKQTSGGGGSPGEALAEISGGYEDIAESTKEATKQQKKYLSGLDEIRTFADDTDKSTEAIGGIGGINKLDAGISASVDTESFSMASLAIDNLKSKINELLERFPAISGIVGSIRNAFEKFKNTYNEQIKPVIDNIGDGISELAGKFKKWFEEDISPLFVKWGEDFGRVWDEHIDPLLANLSEFFGETAENIGYLWNETLKPFISWIIGNILPIITPIIESVGDIIINTFGYIGDIISYLIDAFSGLITFITGVFTGDWERAWNGIVEVFRGIINSILSFIESFVNGAITGLNGIIGGLNKAGDIFGFDTSISKIPEFNIPMLATGAVIPPNAPFMAMLGDQKHGNNLEMPEDLLRKVVREESGGGRGGSYLFQGMINRRVLFEEFIEEAKLRQSTTGNNPFDLA